MWGFPGQQVVSRATETFLQISLLVFVTVTLQSDQERLGLTTWKW